MSDDEPTAPERRWPWIGAASLLLVAAGLLARSVWLHWSPCQGSMTTGLLSLEEGDFSTACLARMDAGLPYVFPTELPERTAGAFSWGAAAMTAAGLVWLVLAVGLRLPGRQRLLLVIPAVLQLGTVALAISEATDRSWGPEQYSTWEWLNFFPPLVAFGVVAAVVGSNLRLLGLLSVVAVGATVGSTFSQITEYVVMATFSSANWDTPPGTGYLTVATLALAAVGVLVLQRRGTRPARDRMEACATVTVSG